MLTFPVVLPPYSHGNTYAKPIIEAASPKSCLARATFYPREYSYETVVRLEDGKWTVETTKRDGGTPSSELYPFLRGHEIGLIIINWWTKAFATGDTPLPKDVAGARATWLSRAAHKLLTEVGDYHRQVAALQILGSSSNIKLDIIGGTPDLKAAQWATQANQTLERSLPPEDRARAVELLIELITGLRVSSLTGAAEKAAA